jgi:pimeloyl-ACP methyl ester carboxylesterase
MPQGNFMSVNGLNIYYEIHGTGKPLILLHGGVGASEMFSPVLPKLAENRQVIPVHLQAHGKTADIDRPLRFEFMADDTAELITQLGHTTIPSPSQCWLPLLRHSLTHPHLR